MRSSSLQLGNVGRSATDVVDPGLPIERRVYEYDLDGDVSGLVADFAFRDNCAPSALAISLSGGRGRTSAHCSALV